MRYTGLRQKRQKVYRAMHYRVIIEQDEDGIFIATCPTLPGCLTQGNTRQEALENIKDAIEGYLESLKIRGEAMPPPIGA